MVTNCRPCGGGGCTIDQLASGVVAWTANSRRPSSSSRPSSSRPDGAARCRREDHVRPDASPRTNSGPRRRTDVTTSRTAAELAPRHPGRRRRRGLRLAAIARRRPVDPTAPPAPRTSREDRPVRPLGRRRRGRSSSTWRRSNVSRIRRELLSRLQAVARSRRPGHPAGHGHAGRARIPDGQETSCPSSPTWPPGWTWTSIRTSAGDLDHRTARMGRALRRLALDEVASPLGRSRAPRGRGRPLRRLHGLDPDGQGLRGHRRGSRATLEPVSAGPSPRSTSRKNPERFSEKPAVTLHGRPTSSSSCAPRFASPFAQFVLAAASRGPPDHRAGRPGPFCCPWWPRSGRRSAPRVQCLLVYDPSTSTCPCRSTNRTKRSTASSPLCSRAWTGPEVHPARAGPNADL